MQKLNWRVIHTHDTEENWSTRAAFIPQAGEIIVYDIDSTHSYERFKIGDGITSITELSFVVDATLESIFNISNNVIYADSGRITDYITNVT